MNPPNASGVPGCGTHGVVMQTMIRLGSPVSSCTRPSATISRRVAAAPGGISPPVKSFAPLSRPAARAAATIFAQPAGVMRRSMTGLTRGPGKIAGTAPAESTRPSRVITIDGSQLNVLRGGSAWTCVTRRSTLASAGGVGSGVWRGRGAGTGGEQRGCEGGDREAGDRSGHYRRLLAGLEGGRRAEAGLAG